MRPEDLKLLHELLTVYGEVLTRTVDRVRADLGVAPTARVKNTGTILEKLHRYGGSWLKSIQDLRGCGSSSTSTANWWSGSYGAPARLPWSDAVLESVPEEARRVFEIELPGVLVAVAQHLSELIGRFEQVNAERPDVDPGPALEVIADALEAFKRVIEPLDARPGFGDV